MQAVRQSIRLKPQPSCMHASQLMKAMQCRCVPLLPADVRAALFSSSSTLIASKGYSGVSSGFNSNGARLQRYIADIGKAKWLIIIAGLAGTPACLSGPDRLPDSWQL